MICIPIRAKTTKEALADMKKASKHCDIIELRVDYIKDLDLKKLLKSKLKQISDGKVIINYTMKFIA